MLQNHRHGQYKHEPFHAHAEQPSVLKVHIYGADQNASCKKPGHHITDQQEDDGCYDVALSGQTLTLIPAGLGSPLDGILQPISDPKQGTR